jgi:L-rhamnose-H+ transport protein
VYTVLLLSRNRTWKNFVFPGSGRALLVGFGMALLWYFDAVAYGRGASALGKLGTVAGWPVFVSSMMIFSTMWGFVTGEWKNANRRALRYMFSGLAVLVIASGFSILAKIM